MEERTELEGGVGKVGVCKRWCLASLEERKRVDGEEGVGGSVGEEMSGSEGQQGTAVAN